MLQTRWNRATVSGKGEQRENVWSCQWLPLKILQVSSELKTKDRLYAYLPKGEK